MSYYNRLSKCGSIKTFIADNMPGGRWLKSFHRRHPILRYRNLESVTSASGKVSEIDISKWFAEVGDYLKERDLISVLSDSTRIYNSDKTSFLMCPKTDRVLAPKGQLHLPKIVGLPIKVMKTLF